MNDTVKSGLLSAAGRVVFSPLFNWQVKAAFFEAPVTSSAVPCCCLKEFTERAALSPVSPEHECLSSKRVQEGGSDKFEATLTSTRAHTSSKARHSKIFSVLQAHRDFR